MIPLAALLQALRGAWELAHGRARGMAWFDTSLRGVWLSFWGPAIALPGVLALHAFDGVFDDNPIESLTVQLIAYVVGCTTYPLLVAGLADGIGHGRLFTRFLVAYNWTAPLQIAVLLPMGLLTWLYPGPAAALFGAIATLALLLYQGYVAHVSLAVSPAGAGLLVLLDLLVGALVQSIADLLV